MESRSGAESVKPIIWTHHAVEAVFERKIDPAWVEAAVLEPDWTSPDPHDPEIERSYRVTAGHGGRILRFRSSRLSTMSG